MLSMRHLSVALGGRRVVSEVDLELAEGSWLAIVGPNGAGKTTLLRALLGLVPHLGEITLDGVALGRLAPRARARLVAYVPQRPVLPLSMTVAEYVALGRTAHRGPLGATRPGDHAVVAEVLERLDLNQLRTSPLGRVSGGEAQRAVLARALAQGAPVLAMDEPTASLDVGHGQVVLELADELRRERRLHVVAALHDLHLAASYADQVLLLDRGEVHGLGTPGEVLTEESIREVFAASVSVRRRGDALAIEAVRPGRRSSQPERGEIDPPVRAEWTGDGLTDGVEVERTVDVGEAARR
jgi:iron complex transport system ATP-binding protein